jgi:hypothetical protein
MGGRRGGTDSPAGGGQVAGKRAGPGWTDGASTWATTRGKIAMAGLAINGRSGRASGPWRDWQEGA